MRLRKIMERTPGLFGLLLGSVFVSGSIIHYFGKSMNHLMGDPSIFLYSGWQAVKLNNVPYLYFFEVKPPGVHLVSWGLAELTNAQYVEMYLLSVVLVSIATISVWVLVDYLATDISGSRLAGAVAALSLLCYPPIYMQVVAGLEPKIFTTLFGLLAVICFRRDSAFLSGSLAALSAGFWQGGSIFILVIGAFYIADYRIRELAYLGLGGVVTMFALSVPFIVTDSFGAMVSQVLATLFYPSNTTSVWSLPKKLGAGAILVPIAGLGYLSSARRGAGRDGAPLLGSMLFLAILVGAWSGQFSHYDMVLYMALFAIGAGLAVKWLASTSPREGIGQGVPIVIGLLAFVVIVESPAVSGWMITAGPSKYAAAASEGRQITSCLHGLSYEAAYRELTPSRAGSCWNPTLDELLRWGSRVLL